MAEVGTAFVSILPSTRGFESKLNKQIGGVGTTSGQQFGSKFSKTAGFTVGSRAKGIFKGLAKAGGFAAVGAGVLIGKTLVDSVNAASDFAETGSKLKQIFGPGSKVLQDWAKTSATTMGQSRQAALDNAASFGTMGKVAGLQGKPLAKFSTGLVGLSGDLASFFNTDPSEAAAAVSSALRGEAEPIRAYGVLLDDATLKAEALALGILKPVKDQAKIKQYYANTITAQQSYNDAVKEFGPKSVEALKAQASLGTAQSSLKKATEGTVPALTAQQKVLAAQSAIMKQTGDAQGDFARTSGGLANQQRILKASFEDTKVTLGTALLPIVTQLIQYINAKAVPVIQKWATKFSEIDFDKVGKQVKAFAADFGTVGETGGDVDFGSLAADLKKMGKGLKDAAKDLPSLTDTLDVASTVLKFAAKHSNLLVKALPFLAAGFLAVKVAQAAGNVAAAVSVPLRIAELVVHKQLVKTNAQLVIAMNAATGSTEAQAVATGTNTAATSTGIIASVRARVATLANAVAEKAAALASKALAAAQWLVNAAMTANPIGLVVVALVALVAAFIIAYKKSETFRKIVNAAFNGVKTVAQAVFDWLKGAVVAVIDFVKNHWKLIVAIVGGPLAALVILVATHWNAIKKKIVDVWNSVVGVVKGGAGRLVDAVKAIPGKLKQLGGAFKDAGKWLIDAFLEGLKNAGDFIGGIAGSVWDAVKGLLNDAIDQINASLEFKISLPAAPDININAPNIPHLAGGGRASRGTLAVIGEGKEPETVLPDSMLRGLLQRTSDQASGQGGRGMFGDVHVEAHDYQDFVLQLQRRARASAAAYG